MYVKSVSYFGVSITSLLEMYSKLFKKKGGGGFDCVVSMICLFEAPPPFSSPFTTNVRNNHPSFSQHCYLFIGNFILLVFLFNSTFNPRY